MPTSSHQPTSGEGSSPAEEPGATARGRGLPCSPTAAFFAACRVGRDIFQEPHGALVAARSADGGQTWEEPAPLLAEPGWDWSEDGGRSWSPLTATGSTATARGSSRRAAPSSACTAT